jgi:2-keto-3-deoxy-galactonokinase
MPATGGIDGPLVQTQDALQPSEGPIRDIEVQLIDAAHAIRHEDFMPMPGKHCRYCRFERVCPSKTEQVIP